MIRLLRMRRRSILERFGAPRSGKRELRAELAYEPHQDILGERRHGRLLTRRQQTCAQFRTELQALELKAVRLMKGCYVVACCRQRNGR